MQALDATDPAQIATLPDSDIAIVVLEGLSMYLTKEQLHDFLAANFTYDMKRETQKKWLACLWGLDALLLIVLIPLGII